MTCLSWGSSSTLYLQLLDPVWFLSVHFPSLPLSLQRAALTSSTSPASVSPTNWAAEGAVPGPPFSSWGTCGRFAVAVPSCPLCAGRFDKLLYVGVSEDRESQLQVLSAVTRR